MFEIEFTSSDFYPVLPEECQTNPGCYGFELAFWLAQALVEQGYVTSYPESEDWGWFIEYVNPNNVEFMIGCSNLPSDHDAEREPTRWLVFIKPYTSILNRLKGVDHAGEVSALGAAITSIIQGKNPGLQ